MGKVRFELIDETDKMTFALEVQRLWDAGLVFFRAPEMVVVERKLHYVAIMWSGEERREP